jgi:hypothetical protein
MITLIELDTKIVSVITDARAIIKLQAGTHKRFDKGLWCPITKPIDAKAREKIRLETKRSIQAMSAAKRQALIKWLKEDDNEQVRNN